MFVCVAVDPGLWGSGQSSLLVSVRFASKKAGGSTKNVGGKSPGRRYGFKKQDGNYERLMKCFLPVVTADVDFIILVTSSGYAVL